MLTPISLPPEVLRAIAGHFDADDPTDRRALRSLLLVSSEWWDAAARVLYRHITLTQPQLAVFLAAGRLVLERRAPAQPAAWAGQPPPMDVVLLRVEGELPDRTRRAFTFVHSLTLYAPLAETDFDMLWRAAAAMPHAPLFPNVRVLRLEDHDSRWYYGYDSVPSEAQFAAALVSSAPGGALFSRPHVCVCGPRSVYQTMGLVRSVESYNAHGVCVAQILGDVEEIPEAWSTMRIYSPSTGLDFSSFINAFVFCAGCGAYGESEEGGLVTLPSYKGKKVQLYYVLDKYEDEKAPMHLANRDANNRIPKELLPQPRQPGNPTWRRRPAPQLLAFDLKVYSTEDARECVPCQICGRRWAEPANDVNQDTLKH